jgi:ATP-dependent protease Clp ATPase subunit
MHFSKQTLEADADSVSGREGKVIVADIDKLVETIENASITKDGKAILLAEAKRVRSI